ncbi:MAG: rhodanese-like domain-containing protein [Boseongicola sp.]|nr:MAG: rhodanese-like domain-containing protein [Boseongicola sp.]
MSTGSDPRIGEVNPDEAWELLGRKSVRIIDVRTQAEWGYVGVPDLMEVGHDLLFVEWASFPNMSRNPRFVQEVMEALGNEVPETLMFICRSGVRSLWAASAFADHLDEIGVTAKCLNVAEGFEGDLDPQGHRGNLNGWKTRGLAWRQS